MIQQQGADRIVVQLPGVQDTTRAKEILGRTATLEVRLVDDSGGTLVDVFPERRRDGSVVPVAVKKQVIVTGDQFVGASATFDQDQRPAVAVELNEAGGRVMRQTTRENLRKPMAIVLFEKNKGEAISVATIQGEFGSRFQITGMFTPSETNDLSLLIRQHGVQHLHAHFATVAAYAARRAGIAATGSIGLSCVAGATGGGGLHTGSGRLRTKPSLASANSDTATPSTIANVHAPDHTPKIKSASSDAPSVHLTSSARTPRGERAVRLVSPAEPRAALACVC